MKSKTIIKIISLSLVFLFLAIILIVIGYVAYVALQYYRIEDGINIQTENVRSETVARDKTLSLLSYNLGFGAYSPEYSFFMDTGEMKDGTKTSGIYAKGLNKTDVEKNVSGQISVAKETNADFCFFQEADVKAHRSYEINMYERVKQAFPEYSLTYAENFHTAHLLYPFNDPIGTTNAGILTLSRYKIQNAVRRSFPLTSSFIDKLFDLDRCFSVHYLPVDGSDKNLVLINLHMSAYDEGGAVRAKQLAMLNDVLAEERLKGNYVVAGGDFNHCLIADKFPDDSTALEYFESEQKTPDWVKNSVLHQSEIAEGYTISANTNQSTCRGADIPYKKGVNYSTVIDGFLVSDNISIIEEYTIDTEYAYSDHNPVLIKFLLN